MAVTKHGPVYAGLSTDTKPSPPSGNIQVTLASETAGTNVTMKAGSWIRYRTI